MLYKIKKFNIVVDFNFSGKFVGDESIYDLELKKMFMFSYLTKEENISASCLPLKNNVDLEQYVDANLKSFTKIKGIPLYSKKQKDKFFVLMKLPYDKVLQVYFIRKQLLYCFSATIPLTSKDSSLTTLNTLKRLLYIISSMKTTKKIWLLTKYQVL